jgi:hypothetical protein
MPAPSRHGGGGVPPPRGRLDELPLRRCNLEDSPPLRRGRGRLQVSLPKYGERRMPSMPSYGDSRRESRPAPPELDPGADVAQRLTNAINAMVNRVVTFFARISGRSMHNSGWPYFDGTYKEYTAFKRKFRSLNNKK